MNGKKMAIIGMCLFMITASLSVVIGKAEDTGTATVDVGGALSSAGIWYPTMGRFTYNNGNAIGNFVHFTINENTGTLSDYTIKLTFYPQVWNYGPIDSKQPYPEKENNSGNITYENKTIFNSIQINSFEPTAPPNAYADYLIFQGKNTLMKCVDQESGSLHYASSDHTTTMTFEVPDGFNITQLSNIYNTLTPPIDEKIGENGTVEIPDQPIPPESVSSPWQTIWIKSDNTTTSINSYNGTIIIDGQTIKIELSAYGYLDVYTYVEYPAPPVVNDFWYNDLNITQRESIIEDAKNNGTITAEGWYTKSDLQLPTTEVSNQASNQIRQGDVTSNYYTYDDPTFEMTFNNVDKTGVDVVVNSQISNGRIVIINVDKELLQTTSVEKLLVSFDSTAINPTDTLESLMEKVQNKDTNASYYALTGEQLTTVFVYVPHFSTHTISIKSLTSGITAGSNVILPIILSALFICLSIGGIMVKKRKQQDDF
jgi:hypothetical protein